MSKIYTYLIRFILSAFIDVVMQTFFNFSILEQIFLIAVIFVFLSIIEYLGFFSSIEKWIKTRFIKKQQDIDLTFLTLAQVVDMFKEHNIAILSGSMNNLFTVIFTSDKETINIELCNLLEYVKNKEITLYGQKTKTINNIRKIHEYNTDFTPFYYKENWTDDLSSVYKNGELLYTNLQIKKTDLDKLIEKYKVPSRD